ncbi:MAG: hypothetical protein KC503_23425 [Myxococcales bacterium]|nr:hypothetical protein [Myxococcales bacterium]
MDRQRTVRVDYQRAHEVGSNVHVGEGFAFIGAGGLSKLGLSWLTRVPGVASAGQLVIPLVGDEAIDLLAGAAVRPISVTPLSMHSVTADKALYREGADVVNLLLVSPFHAGRERTLRVLCGHEEHARLTVRCDAGGCAGAELRGLPAGGYTVGIVDDDGNWLGDPSCTFTVATYRLAPLTATLRSRELDGSRLLLRVGLTTFGVPAEGEVQLELLDDGRRIQTRRAQAEQGVLETTLTLTGEGPHTVNFVLGSDPSRTATLPIVGSRRAERSATRASNLGREIDLSLIPAAGAREVRGLYLSEGASRTAPLSLERIDSGVARLTARADVSTLRALVIDPARPRAAHDAVDMAAARHPETYSRRYQLGAKQFGEGRYEEALRQLEKGRAEDAQRHPYFAYYLGCCYARLGRRAQAVAWLRAAVEDGFDEVARWREDEDLADLAGYGPFAALLAPAVREVELPERIAAGETVEIALDAPLSLLGLGGFVDDNPWEGWAAMIAPSRVDAELDVPEVVEPGAPLRVAVTLSGGAAVRDSASAYLIVKDARLVSPDSPQNRLAAGIKAQLDASQSLLAATGEVEQTVAELVPQFMPPPGPPMGMPMPMRAMSFSGAMPGSAMPAPVAVGGAPHMMDAMVSESAAGLGDLDYAFAEESGAGAEDGARDGGEGKAPDDAGDDVPEVLFAGLVALDAEGRGQVEVALPDAFTDYVVEGFAIAGLDWRGSEARFRAAKDPFVALQMAPFVQRGDGAVGTLHVGASNGPAEVTLTCDGAPLALASGDMDFSAGHVEGGRAALSFLVASPGEYVAEVRDAAGKQDRAVLRVYEPGKIRHVARTLRLLEDGQSVALSPPEAEHIVALRVLPALDKPFKALVHATSDYGHACCEQTAAKMLAAVTLYALVPAERQRAESIILTGIKREESMWLRGRGFKMYPDSSAKPDVYWGPKAAQYLHYVGLLRELSPSRTLSAAIDRCLEMAADTCKAYKLDWPPTKPESLQSAYDAVRFGDNKRARTRAVELALRVAEAASGAMGAVQARVDKAYAAAVLLRAEGRGQIRSALELANAVVSEIGENGALYSTYDSVAAIAMMSELSAAGLVGGSTGGTTRVDVDGREMSLAEAVRLGAECGERVTCRGGVVAVEVTRVIEEDWGQFASSAPLRVSLERAGRASATFSPGDLLDLVVQLEKGYVSGDLLWICLPDALTSVEGGGQIKRRAIDFAGRDELRVPLTATAVTVSPEGSSAPQRYAVCVRNMFDEERAGNPGLLEVTVVPGRGDGGAGGLLSRARALFRRLAGG